VLVCPCGYFGDSARECSCTPYQIQKHLNRISGPLLDRIDIHIQLRAVRKEELLGNGSSEPSSSAYHRILKIARTIADLEGEKEIQPPHISEAIGYRYLDRDLWRR